MLLRVCAVSAPLALLPDGGARRKFPCLVELRAVVAFDQQRDPAPSLT